VDLDAKRVLWIGAHPDDELFVAPLLGCLRERGAAGVALTPIVMLRREDAEASQNATVSHPAILRRLHGSG